MSCQVCEWLLELWKREEQLENLLLNLCCSISCHTNRFWDNMLWTYTTREMLLPLCSLHLCTWYSVRRLFAAWQIASPSGLSRTWDIISPFPLQMMPQGTQKTTKPTSTIARMRKSKLQNTGNSFRVFRKKRRNIREVIWKWKSSGFQVGCWS